jgi:putative transposase
LVVRPAADRALAEFMRRGTLTHSMRWHRRRGSAGSGAVYQGRYRAFPIQTNDYFFNACRYVESNALRASLVRRAEEWPWSSLAAREADRDFLRPCEWPLPRPSDWLARVNDVTAIAEVNAIRLAIAKSIPFGDPQWSELTAGSLGLARGLRPRGRPPSDK